MSSPTVVLPRQEDEAAVARSVIRNTSTKALAWTRSPTLGRLVHLNLGSNQVGDAGVRALAASPSLAGLNPERLGV